MKQGEVDCVSRSILADPRKEDLVLCERVRHAEHRKFMEWLGCGDCMDSLGGFPSNLNSGTTEKDVEKNDSRKVSNFLVWSKAAEACDAQEMRVSIMKEAFFGIVTVMVRKNDGTVWGAGMKFDYDSIFLYETFSDLRITFLSWFLDFVANDLAGLLKPVVSDGYLDGRKEAPPYEDHGKDDKDLEESRKPHDGGKPVSLYEAMYHKEKKLEEINKENEEN